MKTYVLLFSVALISSLFLTPLIRRLCQRRGWCDQPEDDRRLHEKPTPRLGGAPIVASLGLAMASLFLLDNAVTQQLFEAPRELVPIAIPALLIFLFGVYDDLHDTRPVIKFLAQGAAGSLMFALGLRITGLTIPGLGSVELSMAASLCITVFWVVAISNAFNLIDGVDGLAAGAALFAALVMLAVAVSADKVLVAAVTLALAGTLIGFLRYNFNPASIFLGDSGSLFLGFLLAALSVEGSQKASTAVAVSIPILAFGLPVIDTGVAVIRRFISQRPLFSADKEHVHHMLLARGWSQRRVAIVLYVVCASFGILALLTVGDPGGRGTGLILLVAGAVVVFALSKLKYHEADEVKAGVRRSFSDRRVRAANHVRIRRAGKALKEAESLADIFAAVDDMLEFGEFAYASARLGRHSDGKRNEELFENENGTLSRSGAELRSGVIEWSWTNPGLSEDVDLSSKRFWTLRLPLSTENESWGYINLYREIDTETLKLDINYLCNLFQKEMATAAERVLSNSEALQSDSPLRRKHAVAAGARGRDVKASSFA